MDQDLTNIDSLHTLIREQREKIRQLEEALGRRKKKRHRAGAAGDSVIVPEPFKAVFKVAQDTVAAYFNRTRMDPSRGTIEIADERYVLVRASALSMDFLKTIRSLYADRGEKEAMAIGKSLLFDIAHVVGLNDARSFHRKMNLIDPIARLAAGPVHFAHAGWALVEILPESTPTPDDNFFLTYNHPYSFEADAWVRAGEDLGEPVCIMNAGYSSGWCEESFGISLTATEIACRARGDDNCTFVMAPPDRINDHVVRCLAANPRFSSKHIEYQIPTFFKRKQEEEELLRKLHRAEKMEALGILAGGVAHDLNNILSGIVSLPDLILTSLPEDSDIAESVFLIKECGQRAAETVQDLLTLARRGLAATSVVNINDIVLKYLNGAHGRRIAADNPSVRLETELDESLFAIAGSSAHLDKSVMNLIGNAVEAVEGEGRVVIRTRNVYIDRVIQGFEDIQEGDHVVLSVSDTGKGIAPEDRERIFEPFYTTKVLKRHGSGLGLAVVWGTVRDHHGRIDVHSVEGEGTTFDLYFPATRERSPDKPVEESLEKFMGKGEKILVIDDVALQREIAKGILKKLGYAVTVAASGEEAVEFLEKNHADLLLLDMILEGGMDGLETYKRILSHHPGQKALIVSGYSSTARVVEALRSGAGKYIKKPYLMQALAKAVRNELDR